jgi:hypothetical protein
MADISKEVWGYAILGLVAVAVLVHALFPRYEWKIMGDGSAIVVYDRWGGRFQRAVYDQSGKLRVMDVYTPF